MRLLSFVFVVWLATFTSARAHVENNVPQSVVTHDFNGVVFHAENRADVGRFSGFGLPDFKNTRKFDVNTRFQVGSVSKFFTALIVLRLVDKQQLDLDAPIARYLDGLPKQIGDVVTIRHLLSNASGIPDGATAALRLDSSLRQSSINAQDAYLKWAQAPLAFKPGEGWDYSVTNWILIRALLERASKISFEALVNLELIEPLGLANTVLPAASFPFSDLDAKNYSSSEPRQEQQSIIPKFAAASGSFYSCVADIRTIMDALRNTQYLSTSSLQQLSTVHVASENYALGGRVVLENNQATIWTPGKTANYRSLIAYRLSDGKFTVVLNNVSVDQSVLTTIVRSLRDK